MNNDFIPSSELILNQDGSIYHLNLKTEDIADVIITVGDPARVIQVAAHFDQIEVQKSHREFNTITGTKSGKRITVLSTGIGPDNIDIALNELDALVNVDLNSRKLKEEHHQLTFIRVGTSGAMQKDIPIHAQIVSEFGLGFDNLLHYYSDKFEKLADWHLDGRLAAPLITACDSQLIQSVPESFLKGVTATMPGFYAPQGRQFRLNSVFQERLTDLLPLRVHGKPITNLEMETATIYGLAQLMGHRALSFNTILANRVTGEFSTEPKQAVEELITTALDWIVKLD